MVDLLGPAGKDAHEHSEGSWNDKGIDVTLDTDRLDKQIIKQETKWQLDSFDNRKAVKAERKMAKNQSRFFDISRDDRKTVEEALHPGAPTLLGANAVQAGQGLENNDTIATNINYNSCTFRWGKIRQTVHEKKLSKNNNSKGDSNISSGEAESLMRNMLKVFGIIAKPPFAYKERKCLEKKLHKFVKADLEAFDNEQRETMQRMAGYWRYVNKRTYNAMVRENEIWNWATGEKLPEVEENSEPSDTQEDETVSSEETSPSSVGQDNIAEDWCDQEWGDHTPERGPLYPAEPFERCASIGESAPVRVKLRDLDSNSSPLDKRSYCRGQFSTPTLEHPLSSPMSVDDGCLGEQEYSSSCGFELGRSSPAHCTSSSKEDEKPPKDVFIYSKDDRTFSKPIHLASPPKKSAPIAPIKNADLQTVSIAQTQEMVSDNAYSILQHEIPAPNEEIEGLDKTRTRRPTWPKKYKDEEFPALPISTISAANGNQKPTPIKVLNITAGVLLRPNSPRVGKKSPAGLRKPAARNQASHNKSCSTVKMTMTGSDGWTTIAKNC